MYIKNLAAGLTALTLLASTNVVFAQDKSAVKVKPISVAFVYVAPVGTAGWTYQHDLGRQAIVKTLDKAGNGAIKTKFIENVPEGADAERVIRDLATQGADLIITPSFGYMEPTLKVAKEFPKTQFIHVSGYKTTANVANVNGRFYEGRYLAGYLAGMTSKTGVAGYVAAFPIPEVLQGVNAFTIGMRAANPKAQVKLLWTNSWFDPGKEGEAAKTLITQGADIVTHHTGSGAVAAAAEANFDKGVRVIGYPSDFSAIAPKAQLAAVTHHWGKYYVNYVRAMQDYNWLSSNGRKGHESASPSSSVWGGMKDGFVKLEYINKSVPLKVKMTLSVMTKSIVAGDISPFSGAIVDNNLDLKHKGGAMTDAQLNAMNWLVEGVVGSIPK